MQQLLLNTRTMPKIGDDTSFILDTGSNYQCKRMVLNQFVMTNLISNFNQGEQDFSYEIATGVQQLTIKQVHLTLDEFKVYVESLQANFTFTTFTKTNNRLTIVASVNWAPRGVGWKKLGFSTAQLSAPLATNWQTARYYNMTQTPIIYVKFGGNIPNSYTGADGAASFQIQNLSSFGGRLSTDNDNLISNQQVIFGGLTSFRNIQIELQDYNHNKIETQNNNDAGVDVFMSLSLYME